MNFKVLLLFLAACLAACYATAGSGKTSSLEKAKSELRAVSEPGTLEYLQAAARVGDEELCILREIAICIQSGKGSKAMTELFIEESQALIFGCLVKIYWSMALQLGGSGEDGAGVAAARTSSTCPRFAEISKSAKVYLESLNRWREAYYDMATGLEKFIQQQCKGGEEALGFDCREMVKNCRGEIAAIEYDAPGIWCAAENMAQTAAAGP